VAALSLAGENRMHVTHFNWLILSPPIATAIVIALLVFRTRPAEQVTRDRLESNLQECRAEDGGERASEIGRHA